VVRTTRETDIEVEVALFGEGRSTISTGIGFFDHLLDQLARHSGADLVISTRGDLHVDEHHTVEDTALALGQAFRQAWGDLRGMNRYGFVLPMDESRCSLSIDLGGRPYLVWDAEFQREKIGDVPTELFRHFFHSFADGARCTLHVDIQGENEHHKIESAFKALARTLRQAWEGTGEGGVPSTKEAI
jgi:imidazoleglycerol-phosphate dehydratase/histidinol-phosphatase